MTDLPIAVFDIHGVCNQSCAYCVARASKGFGRVVEPESVAKIRCFFSQHGPFNLVFTGGEPLITPNISDWFRFFVDCGHTISIQTNLKIGTDNLIESLPPEKTGWILASLHSVALKEVDRYLENAKKLRSHEYPLVVKIVLDQVMTEQFVPIYEKLNADGIGVMLSPQICFPKNQLACPIEYTTRQWISIVPRITLLSTWLYFAGGFKSRGKQCYAGSKQLYFRVFDSAEIRGCGHGFPDKLGNLYENRFQPACGPVSCGLEQCICDYHYYTGIIPGLDDSDQFKALSQGQIRPVPFSEYQQWIKNAGIEPYLDLEPIVAQTSQANHIKPAPKILPSVEMIQFETEKAKPFTKIGVLGNMDSGAPNGYTRSSAQRSFGNFGRRLREKWRELPATRQGRKFSSEMLEWSDEELLAYWEECKQQTCTPEVRGWYQELYKNEFAGLEIADVGPGVGLDGIFFAEHGAHVTFVDIVGDNLKLLKRICRLKGVEADYYFIDDFFNFHFSKEFDAFVCIGSLINAPFEFMKRQIEAMSKFLKVNGKVLMLAYPKERYLQSGAQDFAEFGKMTDGERTPWAEWYDDEKVEALFGPNFKLNWSRNFGEDNIEFNWFELTKVRCDVYGERKKEYGSTKLRSATHQFTCHGQTPQPTFGQQEFVGIACATEPKILVEPQQESSITIPSVHIQHLHEELGFAKPINYPTTSLNKPLEQWKMEVDDSPIFRYIYRNFRPRLHLEFGTWQGAGTLYCLEECDATVWTINLPGGENKSDGLPAYSLYPDELASAKEWAERIGMAEQDSYRTDCLGFIGRFYLEKGLGSRVCQIYGDSTKWDISNYPTGFFDTALIDGGHQKDIVISDTAKAFELLRSGGLIMWHDFCPPIYDKFETTLGVMRAIHQQWEWINEQTLKLFWIYPSWILVGVKK